MGRGRISMELIQNEKTRRTTFQKRKDGLKKKFQEFTTLCGVDACAIIYAPKFDGQGFAEPETWASENADVNQLIQKYHNTTNDRNPKFYGLQEYFEDKIKKTEGEALKIRKEKSKIMYPTWDESFNSLCEEKLKILIGMVDAKLDACNEKMNLMKGDQKGKAAIADQSDKGIMNFPPPNYMPSNNQTSYLNLMPNMNSIGDNNFQMGQNPQPNPMLHLSPNYYVPMMGKEVMMVPWDMNQFSDPRNGAENNQNSSTPCYCNGSMHTMQQHALALPTQNFHQYQGAYPTLPDPSYDQFIQPNGYYDQGMLQAQIFKYMQERN